MWFQNLTSLFTRTFIIYSYLGFQIAVFLDLFLVLRDPFSPRGRRVKYFLLIPIILICSLFIDMKVLTGQRQNEIKFIVINIATRALITFLLIMIFLRLRKQKTSRRLNQKVFHQYFYLYLAYIPSSLIEIEKVHTGTFIELSYKTSDENKNIRFSVYRFIMITFLLLRIYSEPFLWNSVFKNTYNRYFVGKVK